MKFIEASKFGGRLKLEIAKYPLSEAANVQRLFEARKTSGKLVLIPQN